MVGCNKHMIGWMIVFCFGYGQKAACQDFFVDFAVSRGEAVNSEQRKLEDEIALRDSLNNEGDCLNRDDLPWTEPLKARKEMNRYWCRETMRDEAYDTMALVLESDRDAADVVSRRTRALLDHLKNRLDDSRYQELENTFTPLEQEARRAGTAMQRTELFQNICAVRRSIAFSNPLLDFDRLLFVVASMGGNHMIDQYHGSGAIRAAGETGLFILNNPFSDVPSFEHISKDKTIPSGRLAGVSLNEGAFLSPDLSFDTREVVFAWVPEEQESFDIAKLDRTDPIIDQKMDRYSHFYHIFKMNLDGSGLTQLSDGPWNEFDPCWLPGQKRIIFISECRTGCDRCHEGFSYVLWSMKADGSDKIQLSFHETAEWHPSIDNDGKVIYTRWDYVDRDTEVAHHIWKCFPDGRDPRAPHGNYPMPQFVGDQINYPDGRYLRQNMEMNIRAVPDKQGVYIATAAPHHHVGFGSLVMIDLRKPDDGIMSQTKRITPAVPFPETIEATKYVDKPYATAWPLSEDFFLCNYEKSICLLDRFGNREVLVEVDRHRPLDPIPVKTREAPIIPIQTHQGENASENSPAATIQVANVYTSDLPWPDGVKVTHMRIVQLFPHSQGPKKPGQGKFDASWCGRVQTRMPLGIVPVEEDGSVYCYAPVEKGIYFQLLDENGAAVASMRTDTYLHPGEQLSCMGCHESPWESPPATSPIASRRPPSKPELEAPASAVNPFSFARCVMPVWKKTCLPCHEQNDGPDNENPWKRFGKKSHCFKSSDGSIDNGLGGYSRTTPLKFGAHQSEIYEALTTQENHRDIPKEDLRRITLWLDLNLMKYGASYNTEAQDRGEAVWPLLQLDQSNPRGFEFENQVVRASAKTPAKKQGIRIVRTDRGFRVVPSNDDPIGIAVYNTKGRLLDRATIQKQGFITLKNHSAHAIYMIHCEALREKRTFTFFNN